MNSGDFRFGDNRLPVAGDGRSARQHGSVGPELCVEMGPAEHCEIRRRPEKGHAHGSRIWGSERFTSHGLRSVQRYPAANQT